MLTAEECRRRSAECRLLAEQVSNARVKAILLDMARTWTRLALEAEQWSQERFPQATTYEKDHGRRSAQRHFPQSSSASRRTAAASGYVKTVGRTLQSRKTGARLVAQPPTPTPLPVMLDGYGAAPARSRGTGNVVLHSCNVAPTRQTTMDANSGKPWSKMDISDLRNEIAHGRTVAQTASFLRRTKTRSARR